LRNGGASPIDGDIKSARLRQLVLSNERASADAALRAGIYVKADDVRQQFGAVASRLMTSIESSFLPMANAVVAAKAQTPNDVLRAMRAAWLEARAQAAKGQGQEALGMPAMVESDNVAG
jgi:enoyl-CoA hydratase/carnithine racemase